jgi:hypothetical protein
MASMNIPEEVLEEAARVAWSYEPGASVVEFDRLNPKGRAELIEIAKESTQVLVKWARREALREAAEAIDSATSAVEQWRAPTEEIGRQYAAVRDGLIMALDAVRALAEGDSNE